MKAKQSLDIIKKKDDLEYILVTGAAGYIGSVVTEELIKQGYNIVALDNLSPGHRESVAGEAVFIEGDVGDAGLLDRLFRGYRIGAVGPPAARTLVGAA